MYRSPFKTDPRTFCIFCKDKPPTSSSEKQRINDIFTATENMHVEKDDEVRFE